ncbi:MULTISPECIES: MBL fold metallo-hydrolase [Mycolicibacterium]|uniref:MBL fold metallo-hydrolase n=1 Tax=Mycolicibacterium austroafricanum TaxID=39687 RepID=A0ABT8HBD3_MYCAO|nr:MULTISPECIES: MBL fold metallo-hydrolase [Mycolicibacterium]MDN4518080.1 MBL fold metallo-hydrolase [Mycolicibacterium austroafricanum]PQP47258.1 MBL fold metallo-hydrolase [Mycolicibacterium austroafricanum]QRZ06160.1 MBL fold metallo-hydrolase [Mycolicibacterium austroafricanum]QZT56201.1 MBL fold metallo-hydrolase [Mycolicibacterium austroafricanum]QZT67636.1 MBL fold metallo-hydrolase [Mycolicibacterium austroafricanum]
MKVHHLNCGTIRPTGVGTMVCHVLLVESADGLVLVDTGFGTHDCEDPNRFGRIRSRFIRPNFDRGETALNQIRQLGFRRSDVRHVVVTHFDADHIGGLADFPDALVHVTTTEAFGAMRSPSIQERIRFRPPQWAHGPRIVEHDIDGEAWRGFAAAKELTEIGPGFVLISLPGHTRGHACVAVDAGHRWLLHAGDSFYHPGTLAGAPPVPKWTARLEMLVASDKQKVKQNHVRLAELYRRQDPDLMILCSHDVTLYEQARATAQT